MNRGPHFGSSLCPNLAEAAKIPLPEAAAAGPARDLSPARHQPAVPTESPPPSGNRSHQPLPSPGVPFPERGLEQRRDVRPLDVQICRSAFRHLLPLAAAGGGSDGGGTPQRAGNGVPRPLQSAGRNQTRRKAGVRPDRRWPRAEWSPPWSAASHRPPPVQQLARPPA